MSRMPNNWFVKNFVKLMMILPPLSEFEIFSLIFWATAVFSFSNICNDIFTDFFSPFLETKPHENQKIFWKRQFFPRNCTFVMIFFAEKLRSSSSTPTTKLLSSTRLLKSWEKINKQKRKHADDTQKPKGEVRRTWHFVVLS